MTLRLWIAGALTLIATLAIACGGGANGSAPTSATATATDGASTPADSSTPVAGEATAPASTEQPAATPTEFEALRDGLIDQLDAIGVNIGVLPDDVREDLLARCAALADFADPGSVQDICSAVEQAMDSGDVGLIDLVLDDLAQLEGN